MLTADERRALAGRLRARARALRCDRLPHADLLAAADELERARPLVEWGDGVWLGSHEPIVRHDDRVLFADYERDPSEILEYRDQLVTAGFDVAPLPEVPHDDR